MLINLRIFHVAKSLEINGAASTHLLIKVNKVVKQLVIEAHVLLQVPDVSFQLIDLLLHAAHAVEYPYLRC